MDYSESSRRAFRVRLDDCVRAVWADAISINQDDIEERGHQVSLMRRIYRRAKKVFIWLGEDANQYWPSLLCVSLSTPTDCIYRLLRASKTLYPARLSFHQVQSYSQYRLRMIY